MQKQANLESILEFFQQNPASLEPGARGLERIDTHISAVLLSEEFVYKFKKPVDFGFICQQSLDQRLTNCQKEVELNKRLAAGVYLGVLAVMPTPQNQYTITASGAEAVEYLVKMKRLDDRANLLHRVREESLTKADLNQLAFALAEFHHSCKRGKEINQLYHFDQNLEDNIAQLQKAGVNDSLLNEIHQLVQEKEAALRERIKLNHVIDGHGDLRLDHIYLENKQFEIIDCIEFNDSLRAVDPLEDIAFVSLGLRMEQKADLADYFNAAYLSYSLDPSPGLVNLFEIYRATVRAKVDYLGLQAANDSKRKTYLEKRFTAYIELVETLLERENKPVKKQLKLVMGLPLTGKSTRSRALQEELHLPIIATDIVRKRQANQGLLTDQQASFGKGLYAPAQKGKTYDQVLSMASLYLEQAGGVILDGTFSTKEIRNRVRELAQKQGADLEIIYCHADETSIQQRIEERKKAGSISDLKDFATWKQVQQNFEDPEND